MKQKYKWVIPVLLIFIYVSLLYFPLGNNHRSVFHLRDPTNSDEITLEIFSIKGENEPVKVALSCSGACGYKYLEIRLQGPSLAVCYVELENATSYGMIDDVFESGTYAIELTLLYDSKSQAFPYAPNLVRRRSIDRMYTTDSGSLPFVFIECTNMAAQTRERSIDYYRGYWKRNPNKFEYEWHVIDSASARSFKLKDIGYDSLQKCMQKHQIAFVGDSHTRKWFEYMERRAVQMKQKRWFNETVDKQLHMAYYSLRGIYFTQWPRPRSYYELDNSTLSRSPVDAVEIFGRRLPSFLANSTKEAVLIINSGHWDLRDWDTGTFCNDYRFLLGLLVNFLNKYTAQGRKITVVIRSFPPYASHPYSHDAFTQTKDYRTVAKFEHAYYSCFRNLNFQAELERHLDNSALTTVKIMDSYSLLRSVRRSSCDSVHYICNTSVYGPESSSGTTRSVDGELIRIPSGWADYQSFLSTLCL